MNLTKKIATLGALAVVGAFTVSNAANVGVVNDEADLHWFQWFWCYPNAN